MKHSITYVGVDQLRDYERNARRHPEAQIQGLMNSIREFGFTVPVLVDSNYVIIAGHGRLEAGRRLGMKEVPVIELSHLSPRQVQALRLADNKLATQSTWDFQLLSQELDDLISQGIDLGITGFDEQELDALLREDLSVLPKNWDQPERIEVAAHTREVPTKTVPIENVTNGNTGDDDAPETPEKPVTQRGDIWLLGDHRLVCGDSTNADDVAILMMGKRADMVFTDPPYNVKISGLGAHSAENTIGKIHDEFVMASGEMSEEEFTEFLRKAFRNMVAHSKTGAIHYVCMDWRHMREVLNASDAYNVKNGGGVLASAEAADRME